MKRAVALDLAATQATTGLRIAEGLALEKRDVGEDADGRVLITVRPEVSKTHKGRTIYGLDPRAAERVKDRSAVLSAPTDRVFNSPGGVMERGADSKKRRVAVVGREWNRENAQAAMRKLYDEMADACDVPLLHDVSTHVWRATLNVMWMEAKVPAEIRAAWFGHTEAINVKAYMDVSDIASMANVIEKSKV
ncbi:site-specific integrase [Olegusella massiliensis]|uniref:tyrosine-type recombinase/integrase n=1 Tax=Olegusella massiliensis TaxID=1776381 RepID=UPI00165205C2|nr:tyrosine-type recombinase/integrase [Olegusella massiliensis]